MAKRAEISFKSNLKAVEAALDRAAWEHMERACQHLVDKVKETLSGQRTGKKYIIPGLKTIREREALLSLKRGGPVKLTAKQREARKYTASAPGEPPAVRTGRLRNSIKYRIVGTGLSLRGIVGSPLEYAPYLEFGTSKMERRPSLRPTYERERETVKDILGGKWV
ncbi:MAG: HK97-gp10 family putative phage morphogenesis protein [Bacillota bacterium]